MDDPGATNSGRRVPGDTTSGNYQRELRERYRASWREGNPLEIEDLLAGLDGSELRGLLGELLKIDVANRRAVGEAPRPEDYLRRFPEHASLVTAALREAGEGGVADTLILQADTITTAVVATSDYVDLQFHAAGGLGEVLSARDKKLGRRVALKFISTRHAGIEEIQRRFKFEAEVTGKLDHPGVVPVYAIGNAADGRPFYSMRFIRGEKLTSRIEDYHTAAHSPANQEARRLELRAMVRSLIDVANTVAYAHHRGVAHLDIKPDNIMIGTFGETLVVDWGLALAVDTAQQYEMSRIPRGETRFIGQPGDSSGSGAGTPPYMSPEQCDETWGAVGPLSDIYALGVTLYNILTGRLPFAGSDFIRDFRIPKCEGRFPRPRKVSHGVSKEMEAIVLKAMEPRPEDRYQRAGDFAQDLERCLADEPISIYRAPLATRLHRFVSHHWNWALPIAGGILLALAVTLGAAWQLSVAHQQERTSRVMAETAQGRAESARLASLRMAAQYAARAVASEIDVRLRLLGAKSDDSKLRELMIALAEFKPDEDSEPRRQLQEWIINCRDETQDWTKANNWMIVDRKGYQVARASFDDTTIGKSFWFRDYFTGLGIDQPQGPPPDDIAPVRTPYISNIYQSKGRGHNIRVALMHPIWASSADRHDHKASPIGLIGMGVDIGEFKILNLDEKQDLILVSLRTDTIENGVPAKGIILYHPRLHKVIADQIAGPDDLQNLPRIDGALVDRLEKIRDRTRELLLLDDVSSWPHDSAETSFVDVLSEDPAARYTAVFQPIFLLSRDPEDEEHAWDPGWVVIVEERNNP